MFGWLADSTGLNTVTTAATQSIASTKKTRASMKGKKKRKAKNMFPARKLRANTFEAYVGELYKQDGEEEIRKQFDPLWKFLLGLIAKYNIKR